MLRILIFLLFVGSATTANAQLVFELNAKSQRSFAPTSGLLPGDMIRMQITRGKTKDLVRLHICGTPCNTASQVHIWDTTDFQHAGTASFQIRDPGAYYIWVQNTVNEAVVPLQSELVGGELRLVYPSGLSIRATLVRP
mgnify:FL=1